MAFSFQFVVLGAGIAAVVIIRRRVRRAMAARGETIPPLRAVLADNKRRRQQYRHEEKARRGERLSKPAGGEVSCGDSCGSAAALSTDLAISRNRSGSRTPGGSSLEA